jgi:hypothetical protein
MCKKTPIISAVIAVALLLKKGILSANRTPKGLINAKITISNSVLFLGYEQPIKNDVKTIATGIL